MSYEGAALAFLCVMTGNNSCCRALDTLSSAFASVRIDVKKVEVTGPSRPHGSQDFHGEGF